MKIEIIPAILPKDFAELAEKVDLIRGYTKVAQIDACDGQFVPSASWPYKKHDDNYERILSQEDGLPGWEDINFEIDLMANQPQDIVEDWVTAGASRIIIHAEARGDVAGAVAALAGRVEVGLAFNIDTPVPAELPAGVDFIQLMGIDHIGFQGQEFDIKVLDTVAAARKAHPELPISVDGGVSLETAPELLKAGATRLVIGSAIFAADNYLEAIERFKKLAHDAS